jgi:hypothetical protein
MPEADLIGLFVVPLNTAAISYMVSGSLATAIYGEPRATLDVDIAVVLRPDGVPALVRCFPSEEYYVPPEEAIEVEVSRAARGHFKVIHCRSGLKADFYPSRDYPCFQWALQHRRQLTIEGSVVWVAPPEYVVLWKLDFFREGGGEKHLRDIRSIIQVQADSLNNPFIEESARMIGLAAAWTRALAASQ